MGIWLQYATAEQGKGHGCGGEHGARGKMDFHLQPLSIFVNDHDFTPECSGPRD
jgi:hypothetical protein